MAAERLIRCGQNRTWQLDPRRPFMLEPHSAYTRLMTATYAPENAAFPASCFATRPSQDQINKNVRKPVNAVAVRLLPDYVLAKSCE